MNRRAISLLNRYDSDTFFCKMLWEVHKERLRFNRPSYHNCICDLDLGAALYCLMDCSRDMGLTSTRDVVRHQAELDTEATQS